MVTGRQPRLVDFDHEYLMATQRDFTQGIHDRTMVYSVICKS